MMMMHAVGIDGSPVASVTISEITASPVDVQQVAVGVQPREKRWFSTHACYSPRPSAALRYCDEVGRKRHNEVNIIGGKG